MKKYCLAMLILFFCFQSQAQFRYGVKAGYNNASANYKEKSYQSVHSISAFQVGLFGEIALKKSFLLKSHLLYNQKGNFVRTLIPDYSSDITCRLNYLETDLLLAYKIPVKDISIQIGAGPYLGVGLSGTEKGRYRNFGGELIEIDREVHFSNSKTSTFNTTYFKSVDFGFDFNASFSYKKYMLYLNFSKSVTGRENLESNDWYSKNQVFSIGLGYYLK